MPGRRLATEIDGRKPRMSPPASAPQTRAASTGVASVRSLERALDLMEALERLRSPAGARALEESTGIPKATAQRLLDTPGSPTVFV
jgi:hypothetical protein